MNSYKVYLAGGMSNITREEFSKWRAEVEEELSHFGIQSFDPVRTDKWCRSEIESYRKDIQHVNVSDLVFVNFLPSTKVSIGTCVEIGHAQALGKPIVVVMNKENIHNHVFLLESANTYIVETLEKGMQMVKDVLLP